jgi:phospholipase C
VVIVMMENRSFDHYFGWLANDEAYLEEGRRRYGPTFHVDGRVLQHYRDPAGQMVATRPADFYPREKVETRGCSFRIPGHNWVASRVQRDHGFLATGTGNDEYALTYFAAEDMRIHAALARRFTVFDRWHASLLGPTFPNRQYFLSATSEGWKTNPRLRTHPQPIANGIYHAETILERLATAGVSVGYYYTNVPLIALWGPDRMAPFIHSLDQYFEQAANGTLPQVAFVEPQFGGGDTYRTDDHPRGDIGMGQRWVREVVRAFVTSPHWQRGAFILAYDEHGGFFDHVAPAHFSDARSSRVDLNDFGQGGFRVPAMLASPYARPGAVDHRSYDHTSIMRFLEWRFLGAPAEGTRGRHSWALTMRDGGAHNMAATLRPSNPDPELRFDLDVPLPPVAPACTAAQLAAHAPDLDPDPFASPTLGELAAARYPAATHRPWLADTGL